jgi:hypothetical protein
MAEILVNKGELKNVRDSIDKLLKLGRENRTRITQYESYESEELSGRDKKILKYIEKNQGTTKEDVIKKNPDVGSRMTVVKLINHLIEMRMLIVRRDDSNQHIQHLYTNNEHVVLALINDLEFFRLVYFRLIDETSKKLKELWLEFGKKVSLKQYDDVGHTSPLWKNMWGLLEALLMPYKNLIMMYISSELLLWQKNPVDKETLRNEFAIVAGSMIEIQTKLNENITDLFSTQSWRVSYLAPLNSSLCSPESGLSRQHIISFLRKYGPFKMGAFVEPVLDILWKISYPVLPHVDPFYASINLETLKDWRNIITEDEEFNYRPKTTQSKNLGKVLP